MQDYLRVIYPDDYNEYDLKFCTYLQDRFNISGMLLDVGCGTKKHIKIFNELDVLSIGIDLPEYNAETDKIDCPDNYYNFVFCKSVIEHLDNPENMINEIKRVLKPGGQLIILTPDWQSQMSHFWDDYTHKSPYTIKGLKDLLLIFGFKDVECEYFYQRWFVWKYPFLKFILKLIAICPQSWKWKTKDMRNGEDRKWIRFAKEKMLLATGSK